MALSGPLGGVLSNKIGKRRPVVAFAGVGLWLGGSPAAVQGLIGVIDSYIPGLIRPDGEGGVFTTEQVTDIATGSTGVLAVTGVIAVLTAIWTSIGFVTFTRRAVRDIFGLPFDDRSYVLLKARDFVAAVLFGVALVLGSAVGVAGTWALGWIFSLLGWSTASGWYRLGLGILSLLVSVADTVGRTVIAPAQIPAGLTTALIGAPYFVWLLWRQRTTR